MASEGRPVERALCRVSGINQNYVSAAGTPCHIQVEDYGPVVDRATEEDIRRVNMIIYSSYGTPQARIIFGRDYDYPDVRTAEYNEVVREQMNQLVVQAQTIVETMERKEMALIRSSLGDRRHLSDDEVRKELSELESLHPSLFKRALSELRAYQARSSAAASSAAAPPVPAPAAAPEPEPAPAPPPSTPPAPPALPVVATAPEPAYPLDPDARRRVIEIEALIVKLGQDFLRLKAYGLADDILLQRCKKLVDQAREQISERREGEMHVRRLDLTLENLAKTWRQVRSRVKAHEQG